MFARGARTNCAPDFHVRAEHPGTARADVEQHSKIRQMDRRWAIIVREKRLCNAQGAPLAFWGCLLAILGILSNFGVMFVLVAIVCTLVGLVRGVSARDAISIGTSLLTACLCVVGFASLPFRIRNNTDIKQRQHSAAPVTGQRVDTCRAIRMCGELLSHAGSPARQRCSAEIQ